MGQVENRNIGNLPEVSKMTSIFYEPEVDIRYGDVRVMQYLGNDKEFDQMFFAVKTILFTENEIGEASKKQFQKSLSMADPYLIKLLGIQQSVDEGLCSAVIKCNLLYEYYPHNLRKDFEVVQGREKRYDEIEIVAFLCQIIQALIKLQENQQFHGDLRPRNILMTQHSVNNPIKNQSDVLPPVYKITNIQELTKMNAYKRSLLNFGKESEIYLSQEQLYALKAKSQQFALPLYDVHKSDIFSLGLIALEMATLQSCKKIYDFGNFLIDFSKILQLLRIAKTNYSSVLVEAIQQMLEMSPYIRPDYKGVLTLLANYSSNLNEYLQNCNQTVLPISFKPNQIFQDKLNDQIKIVIKAPDPKKEQKILDIKPPTQELIKDLISFTKEFKKVDQIAKEALKRSQVAQLHYNSSPFVQQWENHDLQVSTCFQSYQLLNPITVTESSLKESLIYSRLLNTNLNSQVKSEGRIGSEIKQQQKKLKPSLKLSHQKHYNSNLPVQQQKVEAQKESYPQDSQHKERSSSMKLNNVPLTFSQASQNLVEMLSENDDYKRFQINNASDNSIFEDGLEDSLIEKDKQKVKYSSNQPKSAVPIKLTTKSIIKKTNQHQSRIKREEEAQTVMSASTKSTLKSATQIKEVKTSKINSLKTPKDIDKTSKK